MGYYNLRYSAKVWLAGMLIGPAIAAACSYCIGSEEGGSAMYLILIIPPIIFIVALFSCLTWVIFWGLINVVIHFVPEPFLQKFWIMLVGTALTLATFSPFYLDNFSINNDALPLAVGYTLGIIIGVWYCDLGKSVGPEEPESIHLKSNKDHEY